MSTQVQMLHKIGTCENALAQPDWTGPAIEPCPAPPAFLCEICGHLLCGGHAGGHYHAADDNAKLASSFQAQVAAAKDETAAALQAKAQVEAELATARQDSARLAAIRKLIEADSAPAAQA